MLHVDIPDKITDIFYSVHRTLHVSVHTYKRIEITALTGVVTDSACRGVFVNVISEHEGIYNIAVSGFCSYRSMLMCVTKVVAWCTWWWCKLCFISSYVKDFC